MGRGSSTPTFGEFWDRYALKRERIDAEKAWGRLSARDRLAAFLGIDAYRDACRRSGVAMKYAQGYLSHRRWEDEETPAEHPQEQPSIRDHGVRPTEMELW